MLLSVETVMWLLPVVFMCHDFEEIVMMQPWYRKNERFLKARFPRLAPAIARTGTLSTSAFALAVAEEFILLSAITLACVELQLYSIWAGFLFGFLIHLAWHAGSFVVMRRYVPYIFTSVIAGIYSLLALVMLNGAGYLVWSEVGLWSLIAIAVIILNMALAVMAAERFDRWLARWVSKT